LTIKLTLNTECGFSARLHPLHQGQASARFDSGATCCPVPEAPCGLPAGAPFQAPRQQLLILQLVPVNIQFSKTEPENSGVSRPPRDYRGQPLTSEF
jgi:hypothetical protein